MRGKMLSSRLSLVLAIVAATSLVMGTPAVAQKEKILHTFQVASQRSSTAREGIVSVHAVVFEGMPLDSFGNPYGTTGAGGSGGGGTMYEVTN